jgi:hypothetical protein
MVVARQDEALSVHASLAWLNFTQLYLINVQEWRVRPRRGRGDGHSIGDALPTQLLRSVFMEKGKAMNGLMMSGELLIFSLIVHADRHHGDTGARVVEYRPGQLSVPIV